MQLLGKQTGFCSVILAGALATMPTSALAQDDGDEGVMLDIRFAGLAGIEPHEKDADAHRAFMMLGERLAELPGEFDGPDEARQAIEMVWELILGATAIRMEETDAAPGITIALSNMPADPATGEALLQRIVEFVEQSGGPIDEDEDGYFVSSPVGPVRVDAVHDGSTMSIRLGTDEAAPTEVQSFGLPSGTTPIMSGQIDLQRLGQFAAQFMAEEPEFTELLEEYQWAIDDAPLVEFAYGTTSDYQIITSRMYDSREWLSQLGTDPTVSFGHEHMASVPQDATVVAAFPFSLDFILDMFDKAIEETGEDPFAEIEEELGFDIRGDVLENLGPRFIYYQSDSTGGGGFLSSILTCEVRNAPALARAHSKLRSRFNEFTAEEARGYIRIRTWNTGGHDVYTLVAPGIPIPFEPSWAILGEQLVIAGSPLGLVEALRQIDNPDQSILDNPKFAEAVLSIMPGDEVASFAFSDTERFAKHGYGTMNYLLSGLSNAVRSPVDPDREAGLLTPSYANFVSGIKPRGTVTYWDGDDYVSLSRLDGSTLVEIAEAFGYIGTSHGAIAGGALGVGVLLPALGKARESAKQLKGSIQVRGIVQSIIIYTDNENGESPKDTDILIEHGYITHELLLSPSGGAYDGLGDIVMRTNLKNNMANSYNASLVLVVERAMYVNGNRLVNVGFADGHVEAMTPWELDDILDQEINEGARENFKLD